MRWATLLPLLHSGRILLASGTQTTTSLRRQRLHKRAPKQSSSSCTNTCPDPVCPPSTACGGSLSECGTDCFDVFIIGAGAAGLGASLEIEKYNKAHPENPKTYKVIEENDEAGGRMLAVHWIHGGEGNPFAELLWEQGRRGCHELQYDVQKWTNVKHYKFVDSTSVEEVSNQESNRLSGDFKDIYDCVVDKANDFWLLPYKETAPNDIGLGEAIDNCSKTLDIDSNINLEWFRFDYEFNQCPDVTSMYGLPEDTYDDFQDRTDWFISDPCHTVELAKREYDYNCITECVEFDTKVLKVAWNDSWPLVVDVENTADDTTTTKQYYAGQVISTVSVGVLDANQGMFEPPLKDVPTHKTGGAISNKLADMNAVFQMGLYIEIAFRMGDDYWEKFLDDDFQFINIDFRNSTIRGHCNWWQVYDTKWNNEFYPGSQMVVCTLTTENVYGLEVFDDNPNLDTVVSDLLRESLGHIVDFTESSSDCTRCNPGPPPGGCDIFNQPPDDDKCFYRFFDHNKTDRWGGGSYENWQKGGERVQFENFQAPLISSVNGTEVVHVAGSAACFNFWGYIHGAFYSGIRAANAALEALGVQENNLPNSPQFCEESPTGGLGNLLLPRAGG